MKELLDKFAEIDTNRDGLVDLNEFAEYLNLPVTRHIRHLFSLYDRVSSLWKLTPNVYLVYYMACSASGQDESNPGL